jgi:hypothetical protein
MYGFKIFRLIMFAIFNTFITGCMWFFLCKSINTEEDMKNGNTFLQSFGIDNLGYNYTETTDADGKVTKEEIGHIQDDYTKMIISCYFSLTTLSTVGYGDLYPISTREMIVGIIVMLLGIVFFSHIMGSFIEIISNYDKRMGSVDRGTELHNWMTLLTRFTNNKPLPKTLIN